jgi:4'-phosphopantetheinyl transferase
VLVRTTLSRYADVAPADWQFAAAAHGRPEIVPRPGVPPLRFSLAHTEGLVAVAVTLRSDVGIDVEPRSRRARVRDIAQRFFSPVEAAALEALPPDRQAAAFLDYWTLKEAYVKATGLGLRAPLRRFSFTRTSPPTIAFDADIADDPSAWQFVRLDLGAEHVAALAVRQPVPPRIAYFMARFGVS